MTLDYNTTDDELAVLSISHVKKFILKKSYFSNLSNCTELERYIIIQCMYILEDSNKEKIEEFMLLVSDIYEFIVDNKLFEIDYVDILKHKCSFVHKLCVKKLNQVLG